MAELEGELGKLEENYQKQAEQLILVSALPGEVRLWWGNRDQIPVGWEICDGTEVKTEGSPLKGQKKPNLVDRFPKGAPSGRSAVEDLALGGSNNMPKLKITNLGGVRVDPAGEHKHTFGLHETNKSWERKKVYKRGGLDNSNTTETHETSFAPDHTHRVAGFVGAADGVNADGGDTSGANQPAYCELFFIIRVR